MELPSFLTSWLASRTSLTTTTNTWASSIRVLNCRSGWHPLTIKLSTECRQHCTNPFILILNTISCIIGCPMSCQMTSISTQWMPKWKWISLNICMLKSIIVISGISFSSKERNFRRINFMSIFHSLCVQESMSYWILNFTHFNLI